MNKSEFFLQRVHSLVWKKLAAMKERQNSRRGKGCLGWWDDPPLEPSSQVGSLWWAGEETTLMGGS